MEIRNKLQKMADQNEDITRENRGLTATVANQGNEIKALQDWLRVLNESFSETLPRERKRQALWQWAASGDFSHLAEPAPGPYRASLERERK